ncbi:MAG: recombinase family protein [Massiliimalia sp.]|jgi:site-specific DNA recombinase
MISAAAYLRVSTQEQTELSPDSQLKALEEYALSHEMEILPQHIFRDDGISGRSAQKRPGFQQMIAAAKSRPSPFSVILVWKFSRFARNQEESIVYKSLLRRECRVEVISVSEPLGEGPFGELIERIIEWMDAFYSIRLAGEVRRGMMEKVCRGGLVSNAALGYRAENGTLMIDSKYQPVIQQIFKLFTQGNQSCREIASLLNHQGVRTRSGKPFDSRTIQYILKNPVYQGKIRWNPHKDSNYYNNGAQTVTVWGTHPPIISQETFALAQKRFLESKNTVHSPCPSIKSGSPYLLRGLVRCSHCQGPMVRSGKHALQCSRYQKGLCQVSHWIDLSKLEQWVCEILSSILPDFPIQRSATKPAELSAVKGQITLLKTRLSKAKSAYLSGVDSLEEYDRNKQAIEQEIHQLQEKIHTSSDSLPQEFSLKELLSWDKINLSEQNQLLRQVIEFIIWDSQQIEIVLTQKAASFFMDSCHGAVPTEKWEQQPDI